MIALKNYLQLEIDESQDGSIFQRMTLTYNLGENHDLFKSMISTQDYDVDSTSWYFLNQIKAIDLFFNRDFRNALKP